MSGAAAFCVWLGYGYGKESAIPEPFEAIVAGLSSDGDSLCIVAAPSEGTCARPFVEPKELGAVKPGATVLITEIWVTELNGDSHNIYIVDVPGR